MGVPTTTGQLRTKIADMKIGDYAICRLGSFGATSNNIINSLGNSTASELPLTGSPTVQGSFYMVKVDRGLLIADRVVRNTIKWDDLNSYKIIEGKQFLLDGVDGILRSLTGGVAYADANGNMSTTNLGFGAFPTNNEWDRYVVNFSTKLIQSGKTLDDVFHWSGAYTWCQETFTTGASTSYRIARGLSEILKVYMPQPNSSNVAMGFRPVFEWNEV